MRDRITWQRRTAAPVVIGDTVLRAEAHALHIGWTQGGLVWNRPVAVMVERDGVQERLPIVDVTRRVQVVLFGLSILIMIGTFLIDPTGRRNEGT